MVTLITHKPYEKIGVTDMRTHGKGFCVFTIEDYRKSSQVDSLLPRKRSKSNSIFTEKDFNIHVVLGCISSVSN